MLRITHESSAKKFAGFPSFCILEEFDRYTGYYWLKTNDPTKGKIVYEGLSQTKLKMGHDGRKRSPRSSVRAQNGKPSVFEPMKRL